MKKTVYTINLPGAVRAVPNKFDNIVDVFTVIYKMFKLTNFHFCIIYENGEYLKKVVNPKFRQVTADQFLDAHKTGMFDDAFICNDQGEKQYWLNDYYFYKNKQKKQ